MTLSPRASITAVHGYLPPDLLTNSELARMVDTSDAWITERTGIKERHILKGEGLGTSHMAAEAVRGLLQKTNTKPEEVDLLICATTTPDMQFPSTANVICDRVGIRNIGSFDVQAACSGFLYSLAIATQFIATGAARRVIVVGADKMSSIIDYTDRATCVLFGDAAGAVLLEPDANGFGIMASGNINLRDPALYRILHAPHPRTGTAWKIYPSYDFAHGQSDAIEHITHSICTLEFEDHRPLYDWFIANLKVPSQPHQYEFARLNLTYTVLSKRVLTELVRDGHVSGWDDPRMPTLAGLRRRGVPAEAIRDFVKRIGVAKANSVVDMGMFDFSVREVLNRNALRRMAVLRPLKVIIENCPEGKVEELEAANHPDVPDAGVRKIKFGRELYIEQDDFMNGHYLFDMCSATV